MILKNDHRNSVLLILKFIYLPLMHIMCLPNMQMHDMKSEVLN